MIPVTIRSRPYGRHRVWFSINLTGTLGMALVLASLYADWPAWVGVVGLFLATSRIERSS